jgi:glycosyltransferase involved in cell wall biosynthesis
MRVAYLTNQYPATSHTFIRREIVALEARGHTVLRYSIRKPMDPLEDREDVAEFGRTRHLLASGPLKVLLQAAQTGLSRPGRAASAFMEALRYSGRSNRGLFMHMAYYVEALAIARWCRQERVEHLHVHFGTNPATVGALVHRLTGIPFSFTVHGPEEFDRAEWHGLGAKVAEASFVAAVSSFGRSQLMRWASMKDWHKIHVVHCGLDRPYFDEPVEPIGEAPNLLCVARLSEQKGLLVLMRAAGMLRDRGVDFTLTLVGDGPLRAPIEAEIRRLDLSGQVKLAGWMGQPQVREQIRRSRAMVLPSFAEGLPVVLMESMALGRPVISTYIAGIPELVGPDTGWLIPAGDAEALCEAMKAAIEASPDQIGSMGARARNRIMQRHDVAESARLIERHIPKAAASVAQASGGRVEVGRREIAESALP